MYGTNAFHRKVREWCNRLFYQYAKKLLSWRILWYEHKDRAFTHTYFLWLFLQCEPLRPSINDMAPELIAHWYSWHCRETHTNHSHDPKYDFCSSLLLSCLTVPSRQWCYKNFADTGALRFWHTWAPSSSSFLFSNNSRRFLAMSKLHIIHSFFHVHSHDHSRVCAHVGKNTMCELEVTPSAYDSSNSYECSSSGWGNLLRPQELPMSCQGITWESWDCFCGEKHWV